MTTNEKFYEVEVNGELTSIPESRLADYGYGICRDCGKLFKLDGGYEYCGEPLCEYCYSYDYCSCEDCGEVIHVREAHIINRNTRSEKYVCDDCLDDYIQCYDCGDYFSSQFIALTGCNGVCICDACEGRWSRCPDCGHVGRTGDMTCAEDDDKYYCDACYTETHNKGKLMGYSYKPEPDFKARKGEALKPSRFDGVLTFGVELEVDDGYDANDLCRDLGKIDQPVYFKHDGSLNSEGVEIVSHPCSLAYHMYELRWAEIIRICKANGYKSHNAGTCGLHIHVGRAQLGSSYEEQCNTAAKLNLIANSVWEQLLRFSRRTEGQLHWCAAPNLDTSGYLTEDELLTLAYNHDLSDRYTTVNRTVSTTVEFRIFRGTLKRSTLMASLQLVSNMCKYASSHTGIECSHVQWSDIIAVEQFKELNAYCVERGL